MKCRSPASTHSITKSTSGFQNSGRNAQVMGCSMITAAFLVFGVYLLVQHQHSVSGHSAVAPSVESSNGAINSGNAISLSAQRGRGRTLVLGPRIPAASQYLRARLAPVDSSADILNDFIIDDEDVNEINKRQSDDYGHMRFGKRDPFDDYGHMRFGRSTE